MRIQWIGGPTFLLELGGFRILCDPVFGEGAAAFTIDRHPSSGEPNAAVARRVGLPPLELDDLDAAIVSRIREDHFDAAASERLDKRIRFIAPRDPAGVLAGRGIAGADHIGPWRESVLSKPGETVTVTAVPTKLPEEDPAGEGPPGSSGEGRRGSAGEGPPGSSGEHEAGSNGYIIRHVAGQRPYTVYWTGDTLWFTDARKIKEAAGVVDLFVPHLGAVGGSAGLKTLNGKQAMQFVFMFQPKRIVPVNYNTFSHYSEPIDDFKQRIGLTMYERRLVILKEGESFERDR